MTKAGIWLQNVKYLPSVELRSPAGIIYYIICPSILMIGKFIHFFKKTKDKKIIQYGKKRERESSSRTTYIIFLKFGYFQVAQSALAKL